MTITEDHPLFSQVFWLDSDRCMRPMLAPHLYYVLVDLLRLWEKPVRIFEIGMCYRKETKGDLYFFGGIYVRFKRSGPMRVTGKQHELDLLVRLSGV